MSEILSEYFKDYFRIGSALNGLFYTHRPKMFKFFPDSDIVKKHFNLIVCENDTKMENVYPKPGYFNFKNADKFVRFGRKNKKDIRWHTLVWHNQSPDWIFRNKDGSFVSKEELEARLKKYIFTIGKRYGNYITSVDVVNECISDKNFILRDGNDRSLWNQIIGPEYIDKAFFWAKQAFPKSSLVINDYNLETVPEKRQGMYNLLKDLLSRGVPVDTVGLQMHINIEYPPVEQIKETIEMYGQLGLNVIVTEMEVSIYKDDKETQKTVTEEIQEKLAQRYKELFECFKMEAQKGILKDVVLWGVTDKFTWKNYFPVPNRKDAPLLFDDEGMEKAAFFAITK